MATATTTTTTKDTKKSPIPKRILSKIDAAFASLEEDEHAQAPVGESKKAAKKVARGKKDVLAYIEDLIANQAG